MHTVLFSNPHACIRLSQHASNGGVAATGWPQNFNELLLQIHQTPPNSEWEALPNFEFEERILNWLPQTNSGEKT